MEKLLQNSAELNPEVERLLFDSLRDAESEPKVPIETFSARIHQAAFISPGGRVWAAKDTLACLGEILQRADALSRISSKPIPKPAMYRQPADGLPSDCDFLKSMQPLQISDFINVIDAKALRLSLNDILREFASGRPHNDFTWLQNMFVNCKKRWKELQEMQAKTAKESIESIEVYKTLDYRYAELKKEATRLEATGVKKMLHTHSFFGRIALWLRTGRNANDQKLLAFSWTNLKEELQAAERERLAMYEAILALEEKKERIGREVEDAKNKLDLIAQFGTKIIEQDFTPLV